MRGINAAVNPCRLEVDPLLGTNASAIGMLGLGHLGDGVGIVDQFGLRIAPGQYHSRIAPAFKGIDDGLGREVVVAQRNNDLVEHNQRVVTIRNQFARLCERLLGSLDIAILVLCIPSETIAHNVPVNQIREAREKLLFARLPFPFDEPILPNFSIEVQWDLSATFGYMGSWSAVQQFIKATGRDPLPLLKEQLAAVWGDPGYRRHLDWSIGLRVGELS